MQMYAVFAIGGDAPDHLSSFFHRIRRADDAHIRIRPRNNINVTITNPTDPERAESTVERLAGVLQYSIASSSRAAVTVVASGATSTAPAKSLSPAPAPAKPDRQGFVPPHGRAIAAPDCPEHRH